MPRYILVMLDKDLIADAKVFDYSVSQTFEDIMKWLLINLTNVNEVHKQDLKGNRPGALSPASELRIVWVKTVKRPDNSENKQIYALVHKFNKILENVIAGDKRLHIMQILVDCTNNHFDRQSNLSPEGLIQFWRCLDAEMKDFDRGAMELEPNPSSRRDLHKQHKISQ